MRFLWILIVLVLVAVVAAAGFTLSVLTPGVSQPIAFSHRLHVEELGSDCTDCHLYAQTGVRATIPNIELCGDCHVEAQTDSEQEAELVRLIEAGEPIPWQKVYRVPEHVYFSHRRHTAIAGIDCETCHGDMARLETPVMRQAVPITMDRCMNCHYETGTSNDCHLCHF